MIQQLSFALMNINSLLRLKQRQLLEREKESNPKDVDGCVCLHCVFSGERERERGEE